MKCYLIKKDYILSQNDTKFRPLSLKVGDKIGVIEMTNKQTPNRIFYIRDWNTGVTRGGYVEQFSKLDIFETLKDVFELEP